MLRTDQINEIHRLAGVEHWSLRRIARQLRMDTRTVKKYLHSPVPAPIRRPCPSQLDPFKPLIAELLEQDPRASGVVILDRLSSGRLFRRPQYPARALGLIGTARLTRRVRAGPSLRSRTALPHNRKGRGGNFQEQDTPSPV